MQGGLATLTVANICASLATLVKCCIWFCNQV